MTTVLLTNEAYQDLLELKNHITIKVRQITNKEVLGNLKQEVSIYDQFNPGEIDYEPEYSISDCIRDIIGSIWMEQKTGKVNFIT